MFNSILLSCIVNLKHVGFYLMHYALNTPSSQTHALHKRRSEDSIWNPNQIHTLYYLTGPKIDQRLNSHTSALRLPNIYFWIIHAPANSETVGKLIVYVNRYLFGFGQCWTLADLPVSVPVSSPQFVHAKHMRPTTTVLLRWWILDKNMKIAVTLNAQIDLARTRRHSFSHYLVSLHTIVRLFYEFVKLILIFALDLFVILFIILLDRL